MFFGCMILIVGMDNIPVIVQHGGHWDENTSYKSFKVFGLLLPSICDYTNLASMICNQLKLQPQSTSLLIQYQAKDEYPPFTIIDDQQLLFYIELKKREPDFSRYPLCLTIENSIMQPSSIFSRSETTVDVGHVMLQITEAASSNANNDITDEVSTNMVADYMDYAELVSGQMVNIPTETTVQEDIIQHKKEEVITDKNHRDLSQFQIYKDKETLQLVVSHYAINNNFQFKVQKSCKKEYLIACFDRNCKWMLRASRNGKTNKFIIRRFFNNHTCALDIRFKGQRQATTTIIADTIKQKFTNIKTTYTVADIIRDMRDDHNVNVKYNKAWRSKEKALEVMRGNATASYAELYIYLYMLYTTNAGSIIELQLAENSCFMYVFVALHASMKGWNYCLPIVVVDGTFLKSAYGGTLLVAATQDAGGRIFPLAFAVVDSENDLSWEWFFVQFKKAYGGREYMIIVSDRHESIIKGANKIYPDVPNVFCIFHLLGNIKTKFKKNLQRIKEEFLSAANAYTVKKFNYHMKELEKVDKRVQLFLEQVGYEKWAKVYSTNNRYSNMTSNVAESLNSVITSIRELPICTMLESLRGLIQKWSWKNRNEANATSTQLTTKYEGLLKINYHNSVDLMVNSSNLNIVGYIMGKHITGFNIFILKSYFTKSNTNY